MSNCVYLIKSNDYFKIGVTSNLPNRIKHFKTGNPDIQLIYVWDNLSIPARHWEKRLHKMLWEFRLKDRKEWFDFSDEIVKTIVQLQP